MSYLRATRVLCWLLGVAFVISIVHYVDNYANYDDYPVPGPDASIPAPSAGLVGVGWFLFTAFGAVGLLLWFRRHITTAAIALTGYSVSGLIGIAHYSVPGAFEMPLWRQAHIVADILCGVAILVFALLAARYSDDLIPPAAKQPAPPRVP
ncbi:hypothetical protein ACFQ0K_05960 [Nocardioides caeni]|uniref:DUF4383 domain-containing protein n=1 Tax=Nocardioides caeni TaxID=574700 RepID=A0A4S8N9H2_9ACTN|nr:hypothetical protein [Nocardioides caeni]THV13007.1 hypothetical protein E9934_11615 [Nocardioides caeni]